MDWKSIVLGSMLISMNTCLRDLTVQQSISPYSVQAS